MMNIGPDEIVVCPHCKGLAKYETMISGNTMEARLWSDGKQHAPSLPLPPSVTKCHHCAQFYWLADAQKVSTGRLWTGDDRPVDPAWETAPQVEEPTEEEYYQAIDRNFANDRLQEKTLRALAWWRRNDAFASWPSSKAR